MVLLEAKNIKHYIKDRLLLKIDELKIEHNDRIGLVGVNGSGKTTLLNILAEKFIPDEGTITPYAQSEILPQLKKTDAAKSGGEITQEYIQQTLNSAPALLLADEPTTNLDTDHIEWVEKKLKRWQGAFVLVSHDREFLDALCSVIWELEDGEITEYKGNYSDYLKQKEVEKQQQQSTYEKYEKEKKQLEKAIQLKEEKAQRATKKPKNLSASERRITGSKPYFAKKQKKLHKTAGALETRVEKLEKVEKIKDQPPIKMDLPNERNLKNRVIIRVEDLEGLVPKQLLWKKATFQIYGGDKLAIIGPNGSGKTTLVKKIITQENGVTISPSVKIGYFSQNLMTLDVNKSILENVQNSSKQEESLIRTVLARMHFFDEDVYKPVHVLSGGERVKVALTKLLVSDINTLVLDEPTNYLDTEALKALENLLNEYTGSIIFVSHDRTFTENIATRILEIRNKKIEIFDGTYQQFKNRSTKKERDFQQEEQLLLDTKISEVLSRLSMEPSQALEKEFQNLLKEKSKLKE